MQNEKIIVSLTSYPARIGTIDKIIECIIGQTVPADKIILYLAEEQFQKKESLDYLLQYKKYGFEIRWCKENLGSHKKYFYAMQEYCNDIIITIDDDVFYKETMIEELLEGFKKNPNAVIARRAHLITWLDDETIAPYKEWYPQCIRYIDEPRMDLVATGCGGILYPPHILPKETFNKQNILQFCKYADDLWLKIMEVINNVPLVLVNRSFSDCYVSEYLEKGLCNTHNAGHGNDIQLQNLLQIYNAYVNETDTLIKRIGKEEKVMSKNVAEEGHKDLMKVVSDMMNTIRNSEGILIYGAGYIARKIYYVMKSYGVQDKIDAFIVQNESENPSFLYDIPVEGYAKHIGDSKSIIIGLAYKKQEEVFNNLLKAEIPEYRIIKLDRVFIKALLYANEKLFNSEDYWQERYVMGGNSGSGSYNRLAEFKAETVNKFVKQNNVNMVIEWGCGDGNQLLYADYPRYLGYDVSQKAVEMCKKRFEDDCSKEFMWCGGIEFENNIKGDLAISLDVIYHLIEDEVFDKYMKRLFESSHKYVCIYSSNFELQTARHVKNRKFTDWIEQNLKNSWKLIKIIKNKYPYSEEDADNTSSSDFYFYEKVY